ncbi:MAG: DUF2281 domain-containing protein [bacterium]|nr:DUF2281 domain-containing protein [bacterium]
MEKIEEKLQNLPPDLKQEAMDFIEFLIQKKMTRQKKAPTLDWIGGLKEFKNQYKSIELQKKALEWRR